MKKLSITDLLNSGSYWSTISKTLETELSKLDEPKLTSGKPASIAKSKCRPQDQDEYHGATPNGFWSCGE